MKLLHSSRCATIAEMVGDTPFTVTPYFLLRRGACDVYVDAAERPRFGVIVPHSVQQAARVADYAAFFLMGELIEHRPGNEIFTTPRNQRTEDYVTGRFG